MLSHAIAARFHCRFVILGAVLTTCLLASMTAMAQPAKPAPAAQPLPTGTFITEKSWGTLTLKRGGGKLMFNLTAVGDNAHTCDLEGEIRGLKADLTEKGEKEGCIVSFKPGADRISVSGSENGLCRNFCGMRADFEGEYFQAPAQCLMDSVEKARAQFRKLYDRKQYAEARALLEGSLKQCSKFMGMVITAWIRNDLSVAMHKQGDRKACLEILSPLAEDAAKKDTVLREELPPTDADIYLPAVRATRTNLKLCNQLKP